MKWVIAVIVREISVEETGPPSRNVVIVCMLMTLIAAWVTDFIGIDAIFGAFVAGIIVPREHRYHNCHVMHVFCVTLCACVCWL